MELKINARRRQHATRGHDRPGAAASIAIITSATLNTIRGINIVIPPVLFCSARAGAPLRYGNVADVTETVLGMRDAV
jgi:hypothetical protein